MTKTTMSRRLSGKLRNRKLATYLLALLTVGTATFVAGTPSASAYDCPEGRECHFVRFVTQGAPIWSADMTMYSEDDIEVKDPYYEWSVESKWGGGETWWWQLAPEDTTTRLLLEYSALGVGYDPRHLDPHKDYCFEVKANNVIRQTGSGVFDENGNWVGEGDPCTA